MPLSLQGEEDNSLRDAKQRIGNVSQRYRQR